MKPFIRAVFFLSLFLFSSQLLFSQAIIGIRGGNLLPFWNLKSEGYDTFDANITPCWSTFGGLNLKTDFDKLINFGGSIDVNRRIGYFKVKTQIGNAPVNHTRVKYKTDFLHFYLFPEISFGGKLKGYLSAGPYFGVTIGTKRSGTFKIWDGQDSSFPLEGSGAEEIKSMDAGIRAEIGGQYTFMEKFGVNVAVSGRKGFSSQLVNLPYNLGVKGSSLEMMFMLGVYYRFENLFN